MVPMEISIGCQPSFTNTPVVVALRAPRVSFCTPVVVVVIRVFFFLKAVFVSWDAPNQIKPVGVPHCFLLWGTVQTIHHQLPEDNGSHAPARRASAARNGVRGRGVEGWGPGSLSHETRHGSVKTRHFHRHIIIAHKRLPLGN